MDGNQYSVIGYQSQLTLITDYRILITDYFDLKR